jgi:hypothetical protein
LAQVFSAKDGKIVRVERSMVVGGFLNSSNLGIFVVHKELKNGDKVEYTIDSSLNAGLNPVTVLNKTKGKLESSTIFDASLSPGFNSLSFR